MSRPSEAEIRWALDILSAGRGGSSIATLMRAKNLILAATKPREVWPAKEVGECLGVRVSNLRTVKGLPEPAWVFDRPTTLYPDKKMSLYWRDEIEALAERKRTEREGG